MALPRLVRTSLQDLASHRAENEVVFEWVSDYAETSRIIRGYCVRLGASEIRLASCGPYIWVRLLRVRRSPYDLLMCHHKLHPLPSPPPGAWRSTKKLTEVGAAELLSEVGAVERNDPAHLVEAGAHAFSDPVAEGFSAAGGARG